jgi:hypothetical protein
LSSNLSSTKIIQIKINKNNRPHKKGMRKSDITGKKRRKPVEEQR